jgi:uncharacterized membrane-anchored protein
MKGMKKILFFVFIVACIIQLAVPAKMIMDKENVMSEGHEYKFRTAPVDPYDPFRGKYITLSFDANRYVGAGRDSNYFEGDDVNVLLGTDSAGFAIIAGLSKKVPDGENINVDYVKAKVRYAYNKEVTIDYPFQRFYMDENKAASAESNYRNANRQNTTQEVYALVYVKEGEAALKDVVVNGVSIQVIASQRNQNRQK